MNGHVLALPAGKYLGHKHRLREKALDTPCPAHGELVFLTELLDAEYGDDVLKVLVTLQHPLYLAGNLIVFVANHGRRQDARGRYQRVDGRVKPLFGNGPLQRNHSIKVTKCRHHPGVSIVIRRNINCLKRGNRAMFGGRNPLLQLTHFRSQSRLVAHGRRHTPQQRGNFHSGQSIPVDIIDKEEHILVLNVAEVFRHGQPGESNAQANAGRLVHLTEDQHRFINDAGLFHFGPQVVTFPRPLTNAGEHGKTAVHTGDIANQLHDDHRFAHPGTTVGADFTPFGKWCYQVNHLEACFQHLGTGGLLLK